VRRTIAAEIEDSLPQDSADDTSEASVGAATAATELAVIWWFALAGLGLIFPYAALYLSTNAGLSGSQTGVVLAMLPMVGLFAQPFWGQVADRTGRRSRVLAGLTFGTALGYALLGLPDSFLGFVLCAALLAFFAPAVVPVCVSVSLALLPDRNRTVFGRVRVMGTLGFAASVGLFPLFLNAFQEFGPRLGLFFERVPGHEMGGPLDPSHSESVVATTATIVTTVTTIEPGLAILFPLAGLFLLVASVASFALPSSGSVALRAQRGEWRLLLKNRSYLRVLALAFLVYLFIQGPMVLFPILVRSRGGGIDAISHMWLIMLVLEVPLVLYFGAGVSRVGARGVIAIGVAAAALRWTLSGFVDDLRWVYLAQALHGVTVWGVILGVPVYIDAIVPARLRSTAQGLLAMVGVALGSMFSNLGSGWLSEFIGPRAPAQIGGLACLALFFSLPWILPRTQPHLESAESDP